MSQHSSGCKTTAAAPSGRYRWVICALLFFATTINYVAVAAAVYLIALLILQLLVPRLGRTARGAAATT